MSRAFSRLRLAGAQGPAMPVRIIGWTSMAPENHRSPGKGESFGHRFRALCRSTAQGFCAALRNATSSPVGGQAGLLLSALASSVSTPGSRPAGLTLFADDSARLSRRRHDARTSQWRSLHKRDGTYQFLDIAEVRQISDEDGISRRRQQSTEGTTFHARPWFRAACQIAVSVDGWSLAAPRPAQARPRRRRPALRPARSRQCSPPARQPAAASLRRTL